MGMLEVHLMKPVRLSTVSHIRVAVVILLTTVWPRLLLHVPWEPGYDLVRTATVMLVGDMVVVGDMVDFLAFFAAIHLGCRSRFTGLPIHTNAST